MEKVKAIAVILLFVSIITYFNIPKPKTYYLYYASGNLAQELNFLDDMHHGKAYRYMDTIPKICIEEIDFMDNKKHGFWIKYKPDGTTHSIQEYRNDTVIVK